MGSYTYLLIYVIYALLNILEIPKVISNEDFKPINSLAEILNMNLNITPSQNSTSMTSSQSVNGTLGVQLSTYSSVCTEDVPQQLIIRTGFSFCLYIRPSISTQEGDGIFFSFTIKSISLEAGVESFNFYVAFGWFKFYFRAPIQKGLWHLFCFCFDPDLPYKIYASVNGIITSPLKAVEYITPAINKDDMVCLGHPNKTYPGSVAMFYMKPLNRKSFKNTPMSEFRKVCKTQIPNSALLFLDNTWEISGDASIETFYSNFCDDSIQIVVIPTNTIIHKQVETCPLIKGHSILKEDVSFLTLSKDSSWMDHCSDNNENMFWMVDENTSLSEKGLIYLDSQCQTLMKNLSVGSHYCVSELKCIVCKAPRTTEFVLYGNVKHFDRIFFLHVTGNKIPRFIGMTSTIYNKGNEWILKSNKHKRFWTSSHHTFPWSRHTWYKGNDSVELILTKCSTVEYACDSGYCIQFIGFCNGIVECDDGSDEKGCRKIIPDSGYNTKRYPDSWNISNPIKVKYDFQVFSVKEIKNADGVASIDFAVGLLWKDRRVKYRNLMPMYIDESLDCNEIWHPKLNLMAGYMTGFEYPMDCYFLNCFINYDFRNLSHHIDYEDTKMGKLSKGDISHLVKYSCRVEFPCRFQLHQYPFGTQICNASLYIGEITECNAYKTHHSPKDVFYHDPKENEIIYFGDPALGEYRLTGITTAIVPGRCSEFMVLSIHLESLYDFHLINSFGPSMLMYCICYTTLFFSEEDFNERIMVSLTSMLVLATMSSQASVTSVMTPYYKLLDIWYTILTCFCFIVVMSNAVINIIRKHEKASYVTNSQTHELVLNYKERKRTSKATVMNFFIRIILALSFIFFLIIFILKASSVF